MPFSTEFWVGTAITFVIAVIGVAVAIAMDAKTKGEFGFVVGCFLTSAAIVVYGIGTWQMNTTLAAKYRIPLALILFAGVAMGTIEVIRWAHGRHLRAESNRSSSGGEVNVPATSVPAPIRSAPPATVAVAAPTKPKHERKESSVPDNSLSSPDIPSVPEENTSALYRPYFSNVGTGGFSRDDSDNSVYLKVPLMNNSLHSAFDLVIKMVLMQQDDFKVVATDSTSLAGEISPTQQTEFFWRTPPAPKDDYDMPPLYVIIALLYSGKPELSSPQYAQMFYMKWGGIKNGGVSPKMFYLSIEERNTVIEKIRERNLSVPTRKESKH